MDNVKYMEKAISLAKKSKEPIQCGAVIVKDGQIIAEAFNTQHDDYDVTAHAEMHALRKAGKFLQQKNLGNATVYCTCEPCSMCSSALIYARVNTIYYGMPIANIDHDSKRIKITVEDIARRAPRHTKVIGKFLYDKCCELYKERLEKTAKLTQTKFWQPLSGKLLSRKKQTSVASLL